MWFDDIKNLCYSIDPVEEDIAPSDFIVDWYAFDTDQDELAS